VIRTFKGYKISHLSGVVPKKKELTVNNVHFKSIEDAKKFIKNIGPEQIHVTDGNILSSDMCIAAAKKIFDRNEGIEKEVDCLIFVTQSPDFHGPMNARIAQHKLGLGENILAIDIPDGCSGFISGLLTALSLTKQGQKTLLLHGDTLSLHASKKDSSTNPLFGDSGIACMIEYTGFDSDILNFKLGGDGGSWDKIYIPKGGYRIPLMANDLNYTLCDDGIERKGNHTIMRGMDVFSFAISRVPKELKSFQETFQLNEDELDAIILHQANMFMLNKIIDKSGFSKHKFLHSISNYGNTSGVSIPLTILSELQNKFSKEKINLLCCGFGIGLAWGTVQIKTSAIKLYDIDEI
jgi:3-oxoacyl-[acyl-carrier-protein] synthase III